jgi:hypothetical protein
VIGAFSAYYQCQAHAVEEVERLVAKM